MDGQVLENGLAGNNLQEMLEDLFQRYLGNERTIGDLLINGRPYREDEHGIPEDIPREAVERLEIESLSSREIAMHFLTTSGSTIRAMKEATTGVAELFRVGDDRQANEQYLQLLESLQLFLSMLERCREVLNLDFGAISCRGVSASEQLGSLQELTGELLNSQEGQDWLLLADLLQYDFNEQMSVWEELLTMCKDSCSS